MMAYKRPRTSGFNLEETRDFVPALRPTAGLPGDGGEQAIRTRASPGHMGDFGCATVIGAQGGM